MKLRDKNGLTEAEFLAAYDASKFPHPSLTADLALLCRHGDTAEVLLIRRGGHPHIGKWALPGGFAEPGEAIEETAARELFEETGVAGITPALIDIYSAPGRDPRGWVVSALYGAVVDEKPAARAADDAGDARWFPIDALPPSDTIAFDHAEMLAAAMAKLLTK